MKPRWKSEWMTPAASGAVAPTGTVQARASFGPAVRYVCSPSVRKPTRISWLQARLGLADRLQQLAGLLLGQLDQLRLDLGVHEDRLGGGDQRPQLVEERGVGQLLLVDVEDVEERLGGEQVQLAQLLDARCPRRPRRRTGWCRCRAARRPASRRRPCAARSLRSLASFSSRGSAFSRVCRSARISSVLIVSMSSAGETLPSTCTTFGSEKARTTWQIAEASRMLARKALPRPCPLEAPRTRPAMSTNETGAGHDLLRAEDLGELIRAARRAARPRRRSARSWRTGSSPRARRSWSAR